MSARICAVVVLTAFAVGGASLAAQQRPAAPAKPANAITPPEDYVIGIGDRLIVQFWRDETMSGEVLVRTDGKITVRLLNDVQAAGLTTEQLRAELEKLGSKHLVEAFVTVSVKGINSREVTVVGEVQKQGPIKLNRPMRVVEALAAAGGLTEFADRSKITVIRTEKGVQRPLSVDFKAISEGKKLEQNIFLQPGDQIIVPE